MPKAGQIEQLKLSGQLPSPKGVALSIMEICRRDETTVAQVARLVQTDPALCGRLLRMANSAAHGARPTVSVPDAVTRLGLAAVRQLAMGFSLVDQHRHGKCTSFDYAQFWSHALLMAVASQELGGYVKLGSPDELFACGLLARVGHLAMATMYPVEYTEILSHRDTGRLLLEREHQALGIDHNQLTAAIMTECGIPKAFAEPAYCHETPAESGFSEGSRPERLTNLFHHASRLANLGLAAEAQRYSKIPEITLLASKLGLEAEEFAALADRIFLQWRDWAELLKVPASTLPPFAQMSAAEPLADAETAPVRVMLVEHDPQHRAATQQLLGSITGQTIHVAGNGQEALAKALEVTPQIIVADWMMPVMDGIDFCRALRGTNWGQSMYVIMLAAAESENDIGLAFEAGANDYVTKPINARALSARMRTAMHYVKLLDTWEHDRAQMRQFAAELAISNRRLEHAALTDLLTGLPNRRAGLNALAQAWSGSDRSAQPLSVMMIDIDNFKSINDKSGHAVGDIVLKEVASAIQSGARKDDSVCRFGGEEFLVVCHNTDLKSAMPSAQRLLQAVRSLKIKNGDKDIRATVSIGVASRESDMKDTDAMVNAADKALYAAKHFGRDQVCLQSQGQVLRTQTPLK